MAFYNAVDYRIEFSLFRFVENVRVVDSYHRLVSRNRNDIERVDLLELGALCHGGTGHTRKLVVKSEVILEGDGGERLRLSLYLNALLCLDCLVQTLAVTTAEHYTSGEFVNYENFSVLYNIVNVAFHNAYGLYCLLYVVENGYVLAVHKVFEVKICLRLCNTGFCERCGFRLFVNYEVAVLGKLLLGVLL